VVELAKLLREVGFDGAGYAILTGLRLDETLRASAEAGLEIYLAAEAGVRISAYNHVKCWNESVPLNVELVKQVNHPQVGFNFNVCHWLKIAGNKDYRPLLQANADKLFCVTICGATNRGEHLDQRPHPAARPRRI
jgi:hypothetical protein